MNKLKSKLNNTEILQNNLYHLILGQRYGHIAPEKNRAIVLFLIK